MSMGHDVCYLYVQMDEQVRRVNVSKLGDESQRRPEFELVSDNSNGELPIGMGCISVNSKLYMVGGQKEQKITEDDDSSSEVDYVPNLKSFVLDLDAHPSIRICEDLPSMHGQKFNPLVVSVNDKFYVLARRPIYNYDKALEQPVFEVFDPAAVNGGSWKELPRPPWTDPDQFKFGGDSMYHHFVWVRKIVFCTQAGFYIFDTDMKKWDFTDEKLSPFPIISCASAEFDGFLIAMPWDHQQLVAYRLDSDSDAIAKPYPCRVLDELQRVFNPPFARHEFQGFLTHLGDSDGGRRMCLLYAGLDYYSRWCARVANFRISISCSDAGDRFPYAYLETLQHYDFEKFDDPARWIDSAFVMCDYLNKHDVEANKSLMDACLFGPDRCDYSSKHDVEADKSLMDACLSGSDSFKSTEIYCFGDMVDYLNNHDVEANARFMDAYPAGSDEADYLNNHDVEANARFMDAYPAGSNEARAFISSTATVYFLIGLLVGIIQIQSTADPFRTHPKTKQVFLMSVCIFSLVLMLKELFERQGQQIIGENYARIFCHVILIIGALSPVSLVSVLVSEQLIWLPYVIWFICSVIVVRLRGMGLVDRLPHTPDCWS